MSPEKILTKISFGLPDIILVGMDHATPNLTIQPSADHCSWVLRLRGPNREILS